MAKPLIYVENKLPDSSPYFVGRGAVQRALEAVGAVAEIVVNAENEPDLDALGKASFFVGSGFGPQRLKAHGRNLKLVHCTSAGVEKYMPLDWLADGAVFTNSSGVHAEKGGVFGAMSVLMALEEVPRHTHNQRNRKWDARLSTGVSGKTVVFVGTGALGSAIARRLRPYGLTLIGLSRSGSDNPDFDDVRVIERLHKTLPEADCLVLSCPLTPHTRGLIGDCELAMMKPQASVFNIARSAVMDYGALVAALESGHIGGAILDVFDQEPLPPEDTLWSAPNLIMFPHISCDDQDGYIDRCLAIFAENVRRIAAGEEVLNRVDPDAGY